MPASISVTTVGTTVQVQVTLGVKGDKGDPGVAGDPADRDAVITMLNIPTYANLAAANAALTIGKIYYDTELGTLNVTTA